MGDRTTVRLTVLKAQAHEAKDIFVGEDEEEYDSDPLWITFVFSECNYGNLGFEDELQVSGISYNKEWDNGGEYTSGTEYCRFTEAGELILKEIYDNGRNPDLTKLLERIDDPVKLRQFILDHKEEISVMELDEKQIEFGKRYRAKQLIAPRA